MRCRVESERGKNLFHRSSLQHPRGGAHTVTAGLRTEASQRVYLTICLYSSNMKMTLSITSSARM